MKDDVPAHGNEITANGSVDVGVTIHHQQVSAQIFRRADAVMSLARRAAGYGQPEVASAGKSGEELVLDGGGLREVAQLHCRTARGNGLWGPIRLKSRILKPHLGGDLGDQAPEVIHQLDGT